MAQLLNRVQPGQLITAESWNMVVDAINGLLQADHTGGNLVAAMMPAGTVADPLRIGALLQIAGQNFGYASGQSSVTFRGPSGDVVVRRADMLTGSSDTRLLLTVPTTILGLPQAGTTMPLRVSNGVANDERSVFVMPIVIPSLQGDVFVNWRAGITPNPRPNPLQAGQQAEFLYQVQTGINMPATFDLSANIPNATAPIPAGLVESIEFRDDSGGLIADRRLEMGRSETRNITVRIPQIPTSWANQSFSVTVTASAGNVAGSGTRSVTVGQPVAPTDPNIDALLTGFPVFDVTTGAQDNDPADGRLVGTTINLRPGKQMVLMFNLTLARQGSYDLTILPRVGTILNGWALGLVGTPSPIIVTIDGDPDVHLVQFGVTASAGATASGTVVFRIKRQGATSDWSSEYSVQLLP